MSPKRPPRDRRSKNTRLARLVGLGRLDPPDEDDWDLREGNVEPTCEPDEFDDQEPEPEPGDFWFDRHDEDR